MKTGSCRGLLCNYNMLWRFRGNFPKLNVAGSNPVSRSLKKPVQPGPAFFVCVAHDRRAVCNRNGVNLPVWTTPRQPQVVPPMPRHCPTRRRPQGIHPTPNKPRRPARAGGVSWPTRCRSRTVGPARSQGADHYVKRCLGLAPPTTDAVLLLPSTTVRRGVVTRPDGRA
jgi:hypothetical protein